MDGDRGWEEGERGGGGRSGDRSSLIYCGLCGALNPATNHYCAACGTTLVDAFHATEGLRVHERPDSASRLVEIVPAGSELDLVEDAEAPADFVRVRVGSGRLGYIRLQELEARAGGAAPAPLAVRAADINTNARGCVSTTGALGSLALLVVTAVLGLVVITRARPADTGILSLVFCGAIVPLLLLTVGLYVAARSREDRLLDDEEELAGAAVGVGERGVAAGGE